MDRKNNIDETLGKRTCRLLAIYKHEKDTNITWLKKDIQSIDKYAKQCTPNNSTLKKGKIKETNQCTLNNAVGYKHTRKSKSDLYNREHSYFEKRVLDKIYYKNKVRNFMNYDFMFLNNDIKVNKCVICAATSCFLIIGIIGAALLLFYLDKLAYDFTLNWINGMYILCLIFVLIAIIIMICLHKEIVKYKKIKHIKSKLHNTEYPTLWEVVFYNNKFLQIPKCFSSIANIFIID